MFRLIRFCPVSSQLYESVYYWRKVSLDCLNFQVVCREEEFVNGSKESMNRVENRIVIVRFEKEAKRNSHA